jgi:NAD(P)-dependent dehydrogenase (short-subunit alcohol dehydrogenase family)
MGMLDGKVALVTGAGGGLGRAHAILLAKEGAKVVVNDLGGARDGTGASASMADGVVDEINASGGAAVAHYGSVTSREDAEGMVKAAVDSFGKVVQKHDRRHVGRGYGRASARHLLGLQGRLRSND